MSELDDSIKKALEQDSLGEDKTQQLKKKILSGFARKMEKAERITYLKLVMFLLLSGLAWCGLSYFRNNIFLQIQFGIMLLLFFVTTVLIKLRYWIVNNKLSVLKEIQLHRLGVVEESTFNPEKRNSCLTKKERSLWTVALISICIVFFGLMPGYLSNNSQSESVYVGEIRLQPDGSGTSVSHWTAKNTGVRPQSTLTFTYGLDVSKEAKITWYDSENRQLTATKKMENGNTEYTIYLIDPLIPGQWYRWRSENYSPDFSRNNNGIWTYRSDFVSGCPTIYTQTVVLPPNADVEKTIPEATSISSTPDGITVLWHVEKESNERFNYEAQYRLP